MYSCAFFAGTDDLEEAQLAKLEMICRKLRLKPGDEVQVLPSGKKSRIERIVTFDGDLEEAFPPQAVTVTLADEIDVSRGEITEKAVAVGQIEPRPVARRDERVVDE